MSLRPQTTDRYGRTVAEVLRDGRNVNLELVRMGQAFVYERNLDQCHGLAYMQAQRIAEFQRAGVWSVPGGITRPWDWRAANRGAKRHRQTLNELLGMDFGKSPSDSTFRLLLAQLDVPGFETLVRDWMLAQPNVADELDTLVCDGKTPQGSIAENDTGAARFVAQVSLYSQTLRANHKTRPVTRSRVCGLDPRPCSEPSGSAGRSRTAGTGCMTCR